MKGLCHSSDMPNLDTERGEKLEWRGLIDMAHWVGKLIMMDTVLNFCQEMALVVFCP